MEVKVIKFERHIDIQKVSVTFSIKKIDTGYATTLVGLVNMEGTDDDMVTAAWNLIQLDIEYWLSKEKNVVGKTFTVPIPAPTPKPEEQTVEVPTQDLNSTDQTDS